MIRSTLLVTAFGALGLLACSPEPATVPDVCAKVGDICTFAGTGTAGFNGDDGPAAKADLYLPMDLAFGPDNNAYIVDWNNHRIRRVTPDGSNIHTVAGKGELGDETADGVEQESSFNHPTSASFDSQGRLVIAAWHNSRLKRLDTTTGAIVNIAGSGKRQYGGDGGPADKADMDLPAAVAFDADGNLFLMDQANQMIRRIDAATNTITRVAGTCVIGTCAPDEQPQQCPNSGRMACGIAANPDICRSACTATFAGDGGKALDARLAQPVGQAADPGGRLAFDPQGNLYFADTRNNRVRKINKDGEISTVAGTGEAGFSGEGGPAAAAKINRPVDVEVGTDGVLYFTDTGNSCVRAVHADGTIHTVAGSCGNSGSEGNGGAATSAKLLHPYGLAFNHDGDLFIADTENSTVRRVKMH